MKVDVLVNGTLIPWNAVVEINRSSDRPATVRLKGFGGFDLGDEVVITARSYEPLRGWRRWVARLRRHSSESVNDYAIGRFRVERVDYECVQGVDETTLMMRDLPVVIA